MVNAPTVGSGGTWLIDPYDLEVVSDAVANAGISTAGTGPFAVTSTGTGARIRASSISTWLSQDINVTLATTGDPSVGGDGNITINAAITKSAGAYSALTLNADGNIYVNANITSTSGRLDLNMSSNYQGISEAILSNEISGATVSLNGGVLNVSDGIAGLRNGNLTIKNGGVLNLSYNTSDPNAEQAGAVAAGNLTVDASSSIVGSGYNSRLTVNSAYTNNGTLTLADTAAMSAGTFTNNGNATLTDASAFTSGGVSNSGNLTLSNASLNVSAALDNTGTVNLTKSTVYTQSGFINEVAGIVKANYLSSLLAGQVYNYGTMTLDSTANKPTGYTGDTTIKVGAGLTNNGTLAMFGTVDASGGDVNNNGNLTLTGANLAITTLNNNAGGTLSGTGTISPPNSGTSTVSNSGTIAPGGDGTVGTLAINGTFRQNAGGTLLLDVAGDNNYDHLNVDPSHFIYLDGTVKTRLLGGYVPTLGQSFQPFGTTTSIHGLFRHVLGDVVNTGTGQQMIKSFTSDSGIFLTMSGSEDITFSGGEGGGWGAISSWSTGYFPTAIDKVIVNSGMLTHGANDGADIVNNISIGAGGTLQLSGGTLQTTNLSSAGSVQIGQGEGPGGGLTVTGSAQMSALSLEYDGYYLNGTSNSNINVTGTFSQNYRAVISSSGNVTLTQTSGDLIVGNVTAATLTLSSSAGAISQVDALHVTRQLTTSSVLGATLDNSNNQIAAYTGANTGSGDIVLVNNLNTTDTSAVLLNGISNTGGNISVDNTGAMVTSGMIVANTSTNSGANAAVSLVTHSPLTIGGAGIQAANGITLAAGTLGSGLSSDSIVINGQLNSAGGVISLIAGGSLNINANISGAYTPAPPPSPAPIFAPGVTLNGVVQVAVQTNAASNTTQAASSSASSQIDRTVNNAQQTTTTTTPDTANPVIDNTLTTGGDPGTFGGSDTEDGSSKTGGTAKKTVKLYCS